MSSKFGLYGFRSNEALLPNVLDGEAIILLSTMINLNMAPRAILGVWNVGHLVDYVLEIYLLNKGGETPHQIGIMERLDGKPQDDNNRWPHLPMWEKGLHLK